MFTMFLKCYKPEKCVDCGELITTGQVAEACVDHEGVFDRHFDCKNPNRKPDKYWDIPPYDWRGGEFKHEKQ